MACAYCIASEEAKASSKGSIENDSQKLQLHLLQFSSYMQHLHMTSRLAGTDYCLPSGKKMKTQCTRERLSFITVLLPFISVIEFLTALHTGLMNGEVGLAEMIGTFEQPFNFI